MPLLRRSIAALFSLLLVPQVVAQAESPKERERAKLFDQKEPEARSQVLEENKYFRVLRTDIAAGASSIIDNHRRDVVILSLGEGLVLSVGKASEPVHLKDGEAQFVPLGSPATVVNSESGTPQILVVELKQHWEAAVRACSEPSKCTRPILIGGSPIGETISLFTNGFVTAYQHRLDLGGALTSSYFSAKGKDHLLLIVLTDLHASFDGSEEVLKAGQAYASDATEIEVNATNAKARWVVIRVQIPKSGTELPSSQASPMNVLSG